MKILSGVEDCGAREANFESLRLALNYLGEEISPAYFHGIAGTAFRIGGICPCAPTCTAAMPLEQLIALLGYEYAVLPYSESTADADVGRMISAVRASIDAGVPALVWNAFTPCEWNVVTGYDEDEEVFFGRGIRTGAKGDYVKKRWDRAKEQAGLTGMLAVLVKGRTGSLNRGEAEIAALKEAVRHANDAQNANKLGGEWVFLQGKAAFIVGLGISFVMNAADINKPHF